MDRDGQRHLAALRAGGCGSEPKAATLEGTPHKRGSEKTSGKKITEKMWLFQLFVVGVTLLSVQSGRGPRKSSQAGQGFPRTGLQRPTLSTAGCQVRAEVRTHPFSSPPRGPSPCRGTPSSATCHGISGPYEPHTRDKKPEVSSGRWQAA